MTWRRITSGFVCGGVRRDLAAFGGRIVVRTCVIARCCMLAADTDGLADCCVRPRGVGVNFRSRNPRRFASDRWKLQRRTARIPFCAQTGIAVSDDLLKLYDDVKLRHKHKYVIFSLKEAGREGSKIKYDWSIDDAADPVTDDKNREAFDAMLSKLGADPKFVIFDFADTKADGRQIKKLILVKWCPDAVSFRVKPVYGASYQVRHRSQLDDRPG